VRLNPWDRLATAVPNAAHESWLETVLARNAHTEYLSRYGSPRHQQAFRANVPIVSYADLTPYLESVRSGRGDVLFAGRPIAFERTGGTSGAAKLIPYTAAGLDDFRLALLPWLVETARTHQVRGRVYLALSPATRPAESIGGVPVGLADGAYIGESAGALIQELSVVPFELAGITDVERWRAQTLRHLSAATDLELISCWSPTFLLRLLDELFATGPRDNWVARLRGADIVAAPINTLLEASNDPDVLANGYVTEVDYPKHGKRLKVHGSPWHFSETPAQIGVAPELGADNEAVLGTLGYTQAQIAGLRERKVI